MREAADNFLKTGRRSHAGDERSSRPSAHRQPLTAAVFFLTPITAILAGTVSVGEISIHAYTSGAMLLLGLAGLVSQRNTRPAIAFVLLALTASWLVVTLLHTVLGDASLSSEVVISGAGLAVVVGLALGRSNAATYRSFFWGWAIAYLIACGYALAEKLLGFTATNNFLINQQGYRTEDIGLASLFGNPNAFAQFLLASAIISYPWAKAGESRNLRILARLVQFSTIYFMLETNSRTGIILLALVISISVWNYLASSGLFRFFVVTLLLLALTTIVALQAPRGLAQSNGSQLGGPNILQDESLEIRWNLHVNGLQFLSSNPFIGVGPDRFEAYMLGGLSTADTSGIVNPHGGLIEILSQYGILVFGLYATFLILVLRASISRLQLSGINNHLARAKSQAQVLLIVLIPITSTMHSTYLGDPAGWLWLAAIVGLELSQPCPAQTSGPVRKGRLSVKSGYIVQTIHQ